MTAKQEPEPVSMSDADHHYPGESSQESRELIFSITASESISFPSFPSDDDHARALAAYFRHDDINLDEHWERCPIHEHEKIETYRMLPVKSATSPTTRRPINVPCQ